MAMRRLFRQFVTLSCDCSLNPGGSAIAKTQTGKNIILEITRRILDLPTKQDFANLRFLDRLYRAV